MPTPTFKAGELDQRVTLRREVQVPDGMGGSTLEWVDIDTVWAKVRPMSGTEREHSDALGARSNYIIVIRYRDDLTEGDIAVWNDIEFNIRFVKDVPRSRWLVLEAERGGPV